MGKLWECNGSCIGREMYAILHANFQTDFHFVKNLQTRVNLLKTAEIRIGRKQKWKD